MDYLALTSKLSHKSNVKFAYYCAALVLPIYEKANPGKLEVRKTLKLVKKWLDGKKISKVKLREADDAASAASYAAAYAASSAAYAASSAASSAAYAAAYAADAVYAAAYAANAPELKSSIVKHAISLAIEENVTTENEEWNKLIEEEKFNREFEKTIDNEY